MWMLKKKRNREANVRSLLEFREEEEEEILCNKIVCFLLCEKNICS